MSSRPYWIDPVTYEVFIAECLQQGFNPWGSGPLPIVSLDRARSSQTFGHGTGETEATPPDDGSSHETDVND